MSGDNNYPPEIVVDSNNCDLSLEPAKSRLEDTTRFEKQDLTSSAIGEVIDLKVEPQAYESSLANFNKTQGIEFELSGNRKVFYSTLSLGCLSSESKPRKIAVSFVNWLWFDRFITLVILINSIILAVRDYSCRLDGHESSRYNDKLDMIGRVLSVIFFFEALLKIVAMGFCMHKTAYLRDGWNILDFFVVLCSVLDFFPDLEVSFLQVLRTFRILRPLRSVNKIKRMKILINSLISSLFGLLNVVAFLTFVLSVFGIFATHQFKGAQYNACRATTLPTPINQTANNCPAFFTECTGDNADVCGIHTSKDLSECKMELHWKKAEGDQADWLCKSNAQCKVYGARDATSNSVD
jgi:hypothetical protein